jgi:hypothetical protein
MDTFHPMATVLSMVLGLGVTRLLLSAVTVFRTRKTSAVDWVPLAWATSLFLTQLEYWWAINQLPTTRPEFSFLDFVSLVVLTLMLFVASALLLPSRPEDEEGGLRAYFEGEGRYALLAMATFTAMGFAANLVFFSAPLWSLWALMDVPMLALLLIGFFGKARRIREGAAALYLPLLTVDVWISLAT